MEVSPDLHAPCGVYCGACRIYHATRDNDETFINELIGNYEGTMPGLEKISEQDAQCQGCRSDEVSVFCRTCSIKDCTREKGYAGCHECDEFPCQFIEEIIGRRFVRDLR
jgi:hypothetical protein